METKNLLILGALEEFVPLAALAEKKGIRPCVIDGNPGAPAKLEALKRGGAAYDIDVRDTEKIVRVIKEENITAITTAYSDLLLECMVRIAHAAGLPCHLVPSQLPWYRDKNVTNRTLEELGIGTPKSVHLQKDFPDSALAGLSFPMVIKPVDMYGSRGLIIVNSPEDIRAHFDSCCSTSENKTVLAEEYNPDHEFNIQAFVRNGTVRILGLADREKTFHDPKEIPLSTRNIYPSRLIRFVYDDALSALARYIKKTGQTEGPLAMQFFWGPERGFMCGEIAARFLGYEHELIEYSDGVSIEELLLDAAFDESALDAALGKCNPFGNRVSAVLYFHGRDGIIADENAALAICRRNDVKYGRVFYKTGERIGSPQRMPYVARYYIVAGTRKEIDTLTEDILKNISVKDRDGRELLYPNEPGHYEDAEGI
ncbi:MAG TPA: ATP-grasp domain-containing protein [Lachnospiraceae bacterium]|nr:ATP-grasp domain-containing protein [Lachnospiraceae bacterium]